MATTLTQILNKLDDNHEKDVDTKLATKISTTGGSITGRGSGIVFDTGNNDTQAQIRISGGAGSECLFITGKKDNFNACSLTLDTGDVNQTNPCFSLMAGNGESGGSYSLKGYANGTLTWNGQSVITTNWPNAWVINRDLGHIHKSNNTGSMVIRGGGSADANGAKLQLYGAENSSAKGDFTLLANDGTQGKTFRGKADGTLTWNSANVLTSSNVKAYIKETYKSGSNWYRKWSDNWIEQGGVASAVQISTAHTITFPTPFTGTDYTVTMAILRSNTDDQNVVGNVQTRSTSSFTAYHIRVSGSGTDTYNTIWYACGY